MKVQLKPNNNLSKIRAIFERSERSTASGGSSDKTFNNLRSLQSLLKKESALKELCKHLN